ncbi:MAG TPA: M28 family peptidase [Pyrinomonadaceae bacterium]|nr:M28 family peptidase [Pyrinomonadaceae bacterium]
MSLPRAWKTFRLICALSALTALVAQPCLGTRQRAAGRAVPARRSAPRATPDVFARPALVRVYQQTVTPAALASHVYFLASDLLEGRETTTRGQKLAAHYLAREYRRLGLAPKGSVKTSDPHAPSAYFQPFAVYRRQVKETRLEVSIDGRAVASSAFSAEAQDDLSYFMTGDKSDAAGGVVFAGHGIAGERLGYNDLSALASKGLSVDGKWVLILDDEPLADAATSLLPTPDRRPSSWSTQFINKRRALWNAGRPAGVLVVRDASPRFRGTFAEAASAAAPRPQQVGFFSLSRTTLFPPTYAISAKLADRILSPTGRTVADLRREINQTLKPIVFDVGGVKVSATARQFEPLETENVLAFVEGSDPRLREEVVVISSHYDHLGTDAALAGDPVYNGAADDASGVAASLELARAFMRAKAEGFGPRRSLLFVNFSGEEKGLIGSTHYAQREPAVPLERTIAVVNMDGVGGRDPKHPTGSRNYVYVEGEGELSEELIAINKRVRAATGSSVELTDAPPGFNSDDRSFRAQLVPFIYYSTGLTEHYHRPSDEPHTLDYEHLARVTQLIFATIWQVANQDARPRSVNRAGLRAAGYACPPCPFECDAAVYERPGECPVCGMYLIRKYER